MRKGIDKSTWVIFVGLIKAFDSINHELIFKLLEKFGIPDRVILVIKNLYKNFKIKLTAGKCVNFVDYSTGVKQGDNLGPILFIIVMQFLAELLEEKWTSNNITKIPFIHNMNIFYKGGELIRHNNRKDFLTKDENFLLLYVNDGALPFVSREENMLGTNIAFETMARLGLNMHVGTKDKASKNEVVYFLSRTKIIGWLK